MYVYLLLSLFLSLPFHFVDQNGKKESISVQLSAPTEASAKSALISLASHYRRLNANFINSGNFFLASKIDSEANNRRLSKTISQAKSRNANLTRIINKIKGSKIDKGNFFLILKDIQNQASLESWLEIIETYICIWDPDCDIVPPTGPGGLPNPPINPGTYEVCNILETNTETICSNLEDAFEECGRGADPVALSIVSQCELNAISMVQQCQILAAQNPDYEPPVMDYSNIIEAICVQFSPSQPQTESSDGN